MIAIIHSLGSKGDSITIDPDKFQNGMTDPNDDSFLRLRLRLVFYSYHLQCFLSTFSQIMAMRICLL